jgi:hypothetical protein
VRVTILASGFIIGPDGSSILDICAATGTDITSHTVKSNPGARCCREFVMRGTDHQVDAALAIMGAAVARYKDLCEGGCKGQFVSREQHIGGVAFTYQPPPRNAMPQAARVKDQPKR